MPREITKEKKAKPIPINHHVKTLLNRLPRAIGHDNVFSYRGRNVLGHKAPICLSLACRKAGIPYGQRVENGITFHDIRWTVKTDMLNAGVDKVHRDLILGHTLKGMDVHCLKPSDEDLKQAMDKFTAWLDGPFSNVDQANATD